MADVCPQRAVTMAIRNRAPFNERSLPVVQGIQSVFANPEYRPPLTVRMLYYQLSTKMGLVPFLDPGYDQVQRITLKMRQLGLLPWGWFADRARRVDGTDGLYSDPSMFWETVANA